MNHLDLFSGIGGFALAVDSVYGKSNHTFVEIDPFCQAVLRKHWPNARIHDDIRTFTKNTFNNGPHIEKIAERERNIGDARAGDGERIHLLTGGFPCQPFSAAGRRAGTEDDRHLWPEMLRVIRETNPKWVIGENVRGFLTWNGGLVLDEVFADLEGLNYEVGAFVVPAVAVGAPHRRDRVWIVANTKGVGSGGSTGEERGGREERELFAGKPERGSLRSEGEGCLSDASDPGNEGLQGHELPGALSEGEGTPRPTPERPWHEDWPEVAARLCTLDDGLPNGLARPRGWRNAALKGAGNAIVPQVAMQILQAIKSCD